MADEKSRSSLQASMPESDKSKWTAKVPLAKPIDPLDVIDAARAIRADPNLWAIFETLSVGDWISEEDSGRLSKFYRQHFARAGREEDVFLNGQEKVLLRALSEGLLTSLDNEKELIEFLKAKRPNGI